MVGGRGVKQATQVERVSDKWGLKEAQGMQMCLHLLLSLSARV